MAEASKSVADVSGAALGAGAGAAPPLDPQLLVTVERNTAALAAQVDHVLCSLRGAMYGISELSASGMGIYRMAGDDLSEAVAQSVANAHMFLRKVQQLHQNLDVVEEYYENVKEIKKTLDMLELQLRRTQGQ